MKKEMIVPLSGMLGKKFDEALYRARQRALFNRRRQLAGKLLTPGELRRAREIADSWLFNAFTPKDFNKRLVEEGIARVYEAYRRPAPKIIYARSPLECQQIAGRLREEEGLAGGRWNNICGAQLQYEIEKQVKQAPAEKIGTRAKQDIWAATGHIRHLRFASFFYFGLTGDYERFSSDGLRALDWCSYYDFLRELKLLNIPDFDRYREFILHSGIFLSIYEASTAIVCPHPRYGRFNEKLDLHCDHGPAVSWEDNYRLYFLNGRITSEVFFMPASDIEPEMLLKEENAEARKEIIKKIGIKRVIRSLGAVSLDKWGNYELLVLNIPSMDIRPVYLKMLNPSTGDWHVEGVPPTIRTCKGALAWRDGEKEYIIPDRLT